MMTEAIDKKDLYNGLASGLEALIDQRENESLDMQLERELSDPSKSLTGLMSQSEKEWGVFYQSGERGTFIRKSSQGEDITGFRNHVIAALQSASSRTKWADVIFEMDTGTINPDAVDMLRYSALSEARKMTNDKDEFLVQIEGVLIAAYLASQTMPEGYDGSNKPKKHKHETTQEILFRKSLFILNGIAKAPMSNKFKQYSKALDVVGDLGDAESKFEQVMSHPDNEDIRKGYNELHLAMITRQLLKRIADPEYTPEMVREENYKFAQLMNMRDVDKENEVPAEGVDIEETKWTILPPGAMEELEKAGKNNGGESPYFIDPERIKWLARLAHDWGPEAYIAIADLKKNGDSQYYAAILPQRVNGVTIEHAVAENASSHNATYVFRAERGIDDEGTPWLTWKDVLSDTKGGARALGARKILHGNYWDENVVEYLTRSVEELDNKNYHR